MTTILRFAQDDLTPKCCGQIWPEGVAMVVATVIAR